MLVLEKVGAVARATEDHAAKEVSRAMCGRGKSEELWNIAVATAEQELQAEFDYDELCKGGKLLYKREEQTKARRIYARLKERERVKKKKLAGA